MRKKLSENQLKLYKAIDEILWNDWDPIGVSKFPEARDEYNSYLPHVFSLVIKNASANEIGQYLFFVETKSMEVEGTLDRCISIAKKIVEEKKILTSYNH